MSSVANSLLDQVGLVSLKYYPWVQGPFLHNSNECILQPSYRHSPHGRSVFPHVFPVPVDRTLSNTLVTRSTLLQKINYFSSMSTPILTAVNVTSAVTLLEAPLHSCKHPLSLTYLRAKATKKHGFGTKRAIISDRSTNRTLCDVVRQITLNNYVKCTLTQCFFRI